jgi:predicted nucleotidyltransferase component of viral defense system
VPGNRPKVVPLPSGGDPMKIKPLQARLQAEAERTGLGPEAVERDYVMSWILAGIASVRSLKETLVLNGGAALRKSYFRGYRFAEEMDFTAVGAVPTGPALDQAIMEATSNVVRVLAPYTPVQIHCEPSARRASREGKEAFEITARFPWQKEAPPVVARITMDEILQTPCASRPVQHDYGETIASQVLVCSLDEIVAEKLRAILEHGASGKSEAVERRIQDYYDLWKVLEAFGGRLDVPDFPALLRDKCRSANLSFQGPESFFPEPLLVKVQTGWEKGLKPLMTEVPLYQTVVTRLSAHVSALLASPRIQASATESPSGESPAP